MAVKVTYEMSSGILVWNFDKENTNAAEIPSRNLWLEREGSEVWNMMDALAERKVKAEDCCVSVAVTSPSEFSFITFGGLRFLMVIEEGDVFCREMTITK